MTDDLITTTQAAGLLGITRQAVSARIQAGKLSPELTLANGGHLFSRAAIEALCESTK